MLRLNPRQQRVLTERFGLDGRQAEDPGRGRRLLGITRERVRQLETRALRELRTVAPSLELYLRDLSPAPDASCAPDCQLAHGVHVALTGETAQRVELDLAHALAREPEPAADLLERLGLVPPSP